MSLPRGHVFTHQQDNFIGAALEGTARDDDEVLIGLR